MEGHNDVPVSKNVLGSRSKVTGTPTQNNSLKTRIVERFIVAQKKKPLMGF